MKRSITILLLAFTLSLSAQVQLAEDWSFKKDKGLHTLVGGVGSAGVNLLVFKETRDIKLARRAGIHAIVYASIAWEMRGGIIGKPISFADVTYGVGSAILFSYLTSWGINKILDKRHKNLLTIEQSMVLEDPQWAIDNEFLNNK